MKRFIWPRRIQNCTPLAILIGLAIGILLYARSVEKESTVMKTWIREEPTLFDNLPMEAPAAGGNVRQTVIDATLAKAREEWKRRYEAFVLSYAANATEPFTAEDVREAYLAQPGVPRTDSEQASGGIFQRLSKQGKLRRVGTKISRKYGNYLTSYLKGE